MGAGLQLLGASLEALSSGASTRDVLSGQRQRGLFPECAQAANERRAIAWLDCLDHSKKALRSSDYGFFLNHLQPLDHWRLLSNCHHDALYLNIETTGLSRELHYITVIGAFYRGAFYQWTWPEPLEELRELVQTAPLVVTFNGRRFDLPFLAAHAPTVPAPRAHVDLLPVARAAGLSGGQKGVEEALGIRREAEYCGLDGAEAVVSWCQAIYGNRSSYQRLLRYNRLDVEAMPQLAAQLCDRLRCALDETASPAPPPLEIPAKSGAGAFVVRRIAACLEGEAP